MAIASPPSSLSSSTAFHTNASLCIEKKRNAKSIGMKDCDAKCKPSLSVVCSATGKFSRGDAPGEYGGPPIDVRIRKTWGGNEPDPITSAEKYIWQTDWKRRLDADDETPAEESKTSKEEDSGFLSLGRSFALDSLDVDLSAQLSQPSKATLERQVAAARRAQSLEKERSEGEGIRWQFAPTKGEEKLWGKANKFTTGGSRVLLEEVAKKKDPQEEREADILRFQKLKADLLLYTVSIGVMCDISAYAVYSPEVTASYAAGLVGAVLYIRMLSSSVEAIGATSVESAAKGALGQPRILVPVILVMTFNRWNNVVAPTYGVMELQLIPMLVGFFTYKAGTLVQTFKEILSPYAQPNEPAK